MEEWREGGGVERRRGRRSGEKKVEEWREGGGKNQCQAALPDKKKL